MSKQNQEEVLMRKYLLGDLDEGLREEVEVRLLEDDAFAERLSAAQDYLIDDYVFNAMTERERKKFETNFILTDERRKKLLFAQTLEAYVEKEAEPQPVRLDDAHLSHSWWRNLFIFLRAHKFSVALSLATAVLLVFITPKAVRWLAPAGRVAPSQAERASIERQLAELNKRPPNATDQAPPSIELALEATRLREGGEMKQVVLNDNVKLLTLKLHLPPERYERYRALVSAVDGSDLFAVDDLSPEPGTGATLLLRIPYQYLPTGDYQVELQGVAADRRTTDAVRYNFRVINNAPSWD